MKKEIMPFTEKFIAVCDAILASGAMKDGERIFYPNAVPKLFGRTDPVISSIMRGMERLCIVAKIDASATRQWLNFVHKRWPDVRVRGRKFIYLVLDISWIQKWQKEPPSPSLAKWKAYAQIDPVPRKKLNHNKLCETILESLKSSENPDQILNLYLQRLSEAKTRIHS